MTYTLFYAKQDGAPIQHMDTWSVYSEDYEAINSPEPIEGSAKMVSGNHTEVEACTIADARQRASYALTRQEQANAQA